MLSSSTIRKLVLPVTRLHVPFLSAGLAVALERRLDHRDVACEVRGIRWRLDLNELVDLRIYYLGTYERFTTRRILQFTPPDGVVFDVGANVGYFTLLMAKVLGTRGKVYAFEPMSRAMSRLREHVEDNHFSNVVAEQVVVTDQAVGPIEVAFRNSWRQFDGGTPKQAVERVETTTLDDYVEAHGIERVDVMKVDVDGYEHHVVRGGRRMLRRFKPVILMEMGEYVLRDAGTSVKELLHALDDLGYRFYSERTMRPYGSPQRLIEAVPENATINVVCKARD